MCMAHSLYGFEFNMHRAFLFLNAMVYFPTSLQRVFIFSPTKPIFVYLIAVICRFYPLSADNLPGKMLVDATNAVYHLSDIDNFLLDLNHSDKLRIL